jgi:hypothetical protein
MTLKGPFAGPFLFVEESRCTRILYFVYNIHELQMVVWPKRLNIVGGA